MAAFEFSFTDVARFPKNALNSLPPTPGKVARFVGPLELIKGTDRVGVRLKSPSLKCFVNILSTLP